MLRKIIYSNEITLWWELNDYKYNKGFNAFINGEKTFFNSTNASFLDLSENTVYPVKIVSDLGETVFDGEIKTPKAKKVIDITKAPYFAVGDGKTLNTKSIQSAINDMDESSLVYIPKGVFLTGALKLKSNSELYLEKGAVLQGTTEVKDYLPKIKSRFEGLEMLCYSSLINIGELDNSSPPTTFNVSVRGKGKIVGGGNPLKDNVIALEKELLKEYMLSLGDKIKECETNDTIPGRARPRLINISNGENIVISGIGIENGPAWNLHYVYSNNVSVYNCNFYSFGIWNSDGIDPDSSTNSAIFNCNFNTGDDCIAIKSGKNPEGNIINRKSENIYVFNNKAGGHAISIGSEMSGGVENVYIWDCDMLNSVTGIRIKATKKRGGYVKNVRISRCKLPTVTVCSVPYNDDGEGAQEPPVFSDFCINDCYIRGEKLKEGITRPAKHIVLIGFGDDAPIKNIKFKNIRLYNKVTPWQAIHTEFIKNVSFENLTTTCVEE